MRLFKLLIVVASLLVCLQSRGRAESVSIIAEDDWYPYSAAFEDAPRGLAVDIVKAVYGAEGIDVQFVVMNYDRGMGLVSEGGAIGCFNAPRTDEIEHVYYWHAEPMFNANSFFYARADYAGSVISLADVAGKRVGLTQGYGYGNRVDADSGMIKEFSRTDTILIKKLLAGRLDYAILFDKVADHLIQELKIEGQIKPVGHSDSGDIYVAFSKMNPDGKKYSDIFSRGFSTIKANGTYQQIIDDWELTLKGQDAAHASASIP